MELFFEYKVNNPDKDAMKAKDKHRANWNDGDDTDYNAVKTPAEVYNAKDRKEIDHVIEDNVQDESLFVDMPVKEDNADE